MQQGECDTVDTGVQRAGKGQVMAGKGKLKEGVAGSRMTGELVHGKSEGKQKMKNGLRLS